MASDMVSTYIQEWTLTAPKYPNPKGPVILAKPRHFDQIVNNPQFGFVLVKALYGYGKTYGFGYGMYHEARKRGTFDVIYINAREINEKLLELGGPYSLKAELLDIIRMICGGYFIKTPTQKSIVNSDEPEYLGIYLTTRIGILNKVCSKDKLEHYLEELGSKDPVRALRAFYINLAASNDKRVVVIIDEFERLTSKGGSLPDPQTLYGWITKMLDALRPGVIDDMPGRFTLMLLIQETYYPSSLMKDFVSKSGHPMLGRMLMDNNDGSISVRYDKESFLNYMERIITELINNKLVPLNNLNIISALKSSKKVDDLINKYLTKMPAFVAFSILNEVIGYAVSSNDITIDDVVNKFKHELDQYPIFKIYAGNKAVAKGDYLANVAAGLLREYYSRKGIEIIPSRVSAVGFEGAHVTVDDEFKAIVFRLGKVKGEQKYINTFKKHYGDKLKNYCAQQQLKKQTQTNCELRFLFVSNVNVGPAYNALTKLKIIDGVRVNFKLKPVEITYDDLFVLLVSYNNDISVPIGYLSYVNQRKTEVIHKIFT